MKNMLYAVLGLAVVTMSGVDAGEMSGFSGRYCEGVGDAEYLKLIDESFQFFHAGENVPNLTMIYQPDWDTFAEGAGWGAWWIQNSYGFSLCATPFLKEPWISILQRSWDLHWDNQGDGKRLGMWGGSADANALSALKAPDGCLGDCARPGEIVYKQGDGDMAIHDWFYEGTAAGVVMQAEILLRNRDIEAINHYLPKMERACEAIERTRDPKNNLFLVGPAANLLAPSYGGVKQADGTYGRGYLAGLSITYSAALERMVELYKLAKDTAKLETYQHRLKITKDSLKLLLTDKGYFVKSIEPDGTKHGVLGQDKYGYMEGVANADAMALRVTDNRQAAKIYEQIESFIDIRPFDFLMTNAPGLDDTYVNWGKTDPMPGFYQYGQWVNGGVWGTVEGRAILGYSRLNKFEDISRSATRAMKWAKDFRMDAPWSQCGENTHNAWSDSGSNQVGGVAVMVDNFAVPAATVRGLFEYIYRADRLELYPHIPPGVVKYIQKEPVWFGGKAIYISINNGPGKISSVKINNAEVKLKNSDYVELMYDELPGRAEVEITMEGAGDAVVVRAASESRPQKADVTEIPQALKEAYHTLADMQRLLKNQAGTESEQAFVFEALEAIESWRYRAKLDPGQGYFRPITPERREGILRFYESAAVTMYSGFVSRMRRYANSSDPGEKQIAALYESIAEGK